jgi:hypothetical protein
LISKNPYLGITTAEKMDGTDPDFRVSTSDRPALESTVILENYRNLMLSMMEVGSKSEFPYGASYSENYKQSIRQMDLILRQMGVSNIKNKTQKPSSMQLCNTFWPIYENHKGTCLPDGTVIYNTRDNKHSFYIDGRIYKAETTRANIRAAK